MRQRIIQVEGLARVDISAFLSGVELVHLEGRNRCCSGFCQVKGLAGRTSMRPISRANVIVRADIKIFLKGLEIHRLP